MSSTILYKFRSGTTFEALPLPGSAARLFDVKKAIVLAKKLDQGSIEFDLSVKDAATNEEYTDDSMLLPRGTRVVVQRLPAAKGYGILSKIARVQNGAAFAPSGPSTAPSNFYTIDSRAQDEDEEFVSSAPSEDKELAALRAATEVATSSAGPSTSGMGRGRGPGGGGGGYRPGGGGPPQQSGGGGGGAPRDGAGGGNFRKRLNADPELREQEKLSQPKKRATGIPRTFLNLSAPPKTDGDTEGDNVPLLQPNAIGFTELVNRGGGQSENASGTRRDLDYAIKLTATVVPDYLKCAIHDGVVRDAMILPWDPEGRTTCEKCIRDALTKNGFRDPLTGQEGVSPDDLIPNHALRKAAEQFIKGVLEKMDEIEKQQVDDDTGYGDAGGTDEKERLLEGDSADKGVIMSKRGTAADRKKQEEDDPFGMGDEDFGGDVFAVEAEEPPETPVETKEAVPKAADNAANKTRDNEPDSAPTTKQKTDDKPNGKLSVEVDKGDTTKSSSSDNDNRTRGPDSGRHNLSSPPSAQQDNRSPTESSRRDRRRRGPPVGYHMGPAGGAAAVGPTVDGPGGGGYQSRERGGPRHDHHDRPRGGRGGRSGGRSSGRGGRFGRDGNRSPRDHGDGDGDDGSRDDTRRDRADTLSDEAESRTSERDYHRNGGGRDHNDYDRDYDRGGDSRYPNDYPPRGRGRSGRGGGGRGRGWQDGGYDRGGGRGGYRGGGGRGGYRGGGGRGGYRGRGPRY